MLYVAFVDYKLAFDSFAWDRLWAKLEVSSVDRRLLALVPMLHDSKL